LSWGFKDCGKLKLLRHIIVIFSLFVLVAFFFRFKAWFSSIRIGL
jgi:hypothetical protein